MTVFKRGLHLGSYGTVDDGTAVFERAAACAVGAEEAGFDAISVPDHVHQNGTGGGPTSPMFEAYTLLGALAMRTTRVKLYALVSPVTLRNPGLLAKAVTTLDVISGGRALLGLGAAWDVDEHAAYDIEFPPTGERFDRLEETLSICTSLIEQLQSTFAGEHHRVTNAYNSPRPIRGSIPILVGGGGEKRTLDLVARYADACNVFGDAETVRHKFDVLRAHCERVGRDYDEITRTAFAPASKDPVKFESQIVALAEAGAQGVVVQGMLDAESLQAIGAALMRVFPDPA
ncbi:MAG: LLM class F420-dependent oxidoreductase [Actinomycetota bacterium]|nr:LLM class F420-dependent oxidoreductase [Actinomycetota bacterium]